MKNAIIKKVSIVIILVMAIFILSGCKKAITSGEVVEKTHRDAYSTVRMQTVHMYKGSSMQIPITEHHPESWYIKIGGYNEKEEYVYATYSVSKEIYDSIKIGDQFTYTKD